MKIITASILLAISSISLADNYYYPPLMPVNPELMRPPDFHKQLRERLENEILQQQLKAIELNNKLKEEELDDAIINGTEGDY